MLKYRLFKIGSVNLSPNSTNETTTFVQKQLVHDLDPDPICSGRIQNLNAMDPKHWLKL